MPVLSAPEASQRAAQAQRQLQMRLELHQQHITAMLKVISTGHAIACILPVTR